MERITKSFGLGEYLGNASRFIGFAGYCETEAIIRMFPLHSWLWYRYRAEGEVFA
jgi:hypothetical protein